MKKADKMLWEGVDENNLRKVALALNLGANINAKEIRYGSTPLHRASRNGHTEIAKLLIQAGADVNAKDYYNNMPLHEASWKGHTKIVKLLIEAGANVQVEDEYGCKPLYVASNWGHTETAKLLIEAGATI